MHCNWKLDNSLCNMVTLLVSFVSGVLFVGFNLLLFIVVIIVV